MNMSCIGQHWVPVGSRECPVISRVSVSELKSVSLILIPERRGRGGTHKLEEDVPQGVVVLRLRLQVGLQR